jgi:hypothetical protein
MRFCLTASSDGSDRRHCAAMYVMELTDRAVSETSIATRKCFACGGLPSSGSGEHIIPKWLQNEQRLFDERLTLLNGTQIPYRHLTVPCCVECNTGFLSGIESAVQPLFHRGHIEDSQERLALARWLSKIHPADARGGHGLGAGLAATACTNRKSQAIIATATTPTPRPRRMNATSF